MGEEGEGGREGPRGLQGRRWQEIIYSITGIFCSPRSKVPAVHYRGDDLCTNRHDSEQHLCLLPLELPSSNTHVSTWQESQPAQLPRNTDRGAFSHCWIPTTGREPAHGPGTLASTVKGGAACPVVRLPVCRSPRHTGVRPSPPRPHHPVCEHQE